MIRAVLIGMLREASNRGPQRSGPLGAESGVMSDPAITAQRSDIPEYVEAVKQGTA
jgi:hypothetical protein